MPIVTVLPLKTESCPWKPEVYISQFISENGRLQSVRFDPGRSAAGAAQGEGRSLGPVLKCLVGVIPTAPEAHDVMAADATVEGRTQQFVGAGIGDLDLVASPPANTWGMDSTKTK